MPGVVEVELITTIESPRPDAAGAAGGSLTGSVTSAGGSAGAAGGSLTGSSLTGGSLTGGSLTGSVTSAGGSAGAAGGSLTGSVTSAGGSAGAAGGSLTGSVTSAGGSAGVTGASPTGSAPTWACATPAHAKQTRAIASATPRCGVFGGRALIPRSPRRRAVSVGEKLPSDWPHVTRTLVMTGKVRVPPFRNRCSRPRQSDLFRVVQFSLSDHEVCRDSAQEFDVGYRLVAAAQGRRKGGRSRPFALASGANLWASTTSSASP